MAVGRPMPLLILDDVERETTERWERRPTPSIPKPLPIRGQHADYDLTLHPQCPAVGHRDRSDPRAGTQPNRPECTKRRCK